jgi:hypothetical protein
MTLLADNPNGGLKFFRKEKEVYSISHFEDHFTSYQ